jgi:hypothetical protein
LDDLANPQAGLANLWLDWQAYLYMRMQWLTMVLSDAKLAKELADSDHRLIRLATQEVTRVSRPSHTKPHTDRLTSKEDLRVEYSLATQEITRVSRPSHTKG